MSARVQAGLEAVQLVAARADPTAPMPVGAIAAQLGVGLSSASRLCAALDDVGLLAHSDAYGAYRLGVAAISLSGAAAAPFARAVRLELTRAALRSGETVCLAATTDRMRLIAVIDSPWTLHAPAAVGEAVADPDGAILGAARGGGTRAEGACAESTSGRQVEVAAPVLDPGGDCVAVLAIRMPMYRAERGVPLARRALRDARRSLERQLERAEVERAVPSAGNPPATAAEPALAATVRILGLLAAGPVPLAGIAAALGMRTDRVRRLVDACRRAGTVAGDDRHGLRVSWGVHGWYRAALNPTLAAEGAPLVAEAAAATGACAFLTVLKGMRSYTLVEHLEELGDGLRMRPWLGRVHPIVGSDGGPTMLMDLEVEQLAELFPARVSVAERERFLQRVQEVARDDVLTIESIDELGITSISAPVRDASGTVAAAACLVGATERVAPQRAALEAAARALAARVSSRLS